MIHMVMHKSHNNKHMWTHNPDYKEFTDYAKVPCMLLANPCSSCRSSTQQEFSNQSPN